MRFACLMSVCGVIGLAISSVANGDAKMAPPTDPLATGFAEPPLEARPRVWWHWLNGAIAEPGIKLDLEWMQRAGIGGVQIFNGAMPNNDDVMPPVPYMSPAWQSAMRSAVSQAAVQGMEVAVPTSAGWSETGAPFVQPQDGMKKFVWTETEITGGRKFTGVLPQPSDVSGPFATIEADDKTLTGQSIALKIPHFYADAHVIAYRIPAAEQPLALPKVTTANGVVDAAPLFDGKLENAIEIERPTKAKPTWIQYEYAKPVTLRSLTAVLEPKKPQIAVSTAIPARLEVSADGINFNKVADVTVGAFIQNTSSFAPVTGRIFRVVLQPAAPSGNPTAGLDLAPGALLQPGLPSLLPAKTLIVSEMALSAAARVQRFEEKAGFASVPDYFAVPTPAADVNTVVHKADVIDLTGKMATDGTLDWTPPKGRWRIVRFGYSLTGHTNGPASVEATGLEVDKLSALRVRAYMNTYLDQIAQAAGPGVRATVSDSIEAGFSNWTDDIVQQFKTLRGYDPLPFLPVLTGRVVDSAAVSDAFLYDFRRTLMDLLASAHYGEVARAAQARGMTVYGEALEAPNRPILGDDIAMRAHADVPMGAMWTFKPEKGPAPYFVADIKGAASAAHLYGHQYIGAESMSSMFQYWAYSPRQLKHVVDTEFALGVNHLSIHSSVHQPFVDKAPGLALWIFGQNFNRHDSWAELARPWVDYLARTQWLLAQGRFAADVAYFYGEEAPLVTLAADGKLNDAPVHYGYDYVNADALLSLLSVRDGKLVTPSGMQYRVLQLGGSSQQMTLPVLRKIRELVSAGAIVVGNKPIGSPSLADDPAAFRKVANELWSGGSETETARGKGKVIAGTAVEMALASLGVQPDQEVLGSNASPLQFQHRYLDDGELWFISNPKATPFSAEVALRIDGRIPELWDADTGNSASLSYRVEKGRTIVPLALDGSGSALIVFRQASSASSRSVAPLATRPLAQLDGDWSVRFQPQRGAPPGDVKLAAGSWTDNADSGIRYFSGSAVYVKTVRVPKVAKSNRVMLDLGEVGDIAEIVVNGKTIRTVWKPPYRADITDALKSGNNDIRITIANRWVNRLIGDVQPGATKIGWTVKPTYSAKAPLLPSGMIGPVQLLEVTAVAE